MYQVQIYSFPSVSPLFLKYIVYERLEMKRINWASAVINAGRYKWKCCQSFKLNNLNI